MHLRLILQPMMAMLLGIGAGWADARAGRPIFLTTLVREPAKARTVLRNLWTFVGKVFLVAIALDVVYQLIVFHWIYPVEAIIVAVVLALVPCVVVRAIGNRIVTFLSRKRHAT